MQFPSTATIVQQKLGIANGCPAFDVQAVCAGFMYALSTANAYIKSGMAKRLWSSARKRSAASWIETTARPAFCSATAQARSCWVRPMKRASSTANSKPTATTSTCSTYPVKSPTDKFAARPTLRWMGRRVQIRSQNARKNRRRSHQRSRLYPDQIDWLVPHQANKRIIDSTAKHLGLDMEKSS